MRWRQDDEEEEEEDEDEDEEKNPRIASGSQEACDCWTVLETCE